VAGALKSEKPETFVARCLAGTAAPSEIDDFVERWHSSESSRSLRRCLGFTADEYALWVKQPRAVGIILFARAQRMGLGEAVSLWDQVAGAAKAVLSMRKRPRQLAKAGRHAG
jgi:hypothetical protein